MSRTSANLKSPVHTFRSCEKYVPCDMYMYFAEYTPSLSVSVSKGDKQLTVDDTTGISAGDVITIYEDCWIFQNLVNSVIDGTHLTLKVGVDYDFTTDCEIEVGSWNAGGLDGSGTTKKFYIKAPPSGNYVIRTLNVSMLDSSDMDDGMFGGLSELTNGIQFAIDNGFSKNLALVVNNLGFWEIGFDCVYSSKAPSGQYGFKARRDILGVNGVDVILEAGTTAEFQVFINDDLDGLDLLDFVVNGHLVPVNC